MFLAPTNTDFQNLSKIIIGTSILGIETRVLAILVQTVYAVNKIFRSRIPWNAHYFLDSRAAMCRVGCTYWLRSSGLRAPWPGDWALPQWAWSYRVHGIFFSFASNWHSSSWSAALGMVGNRQPSIVIPFYRCDLEEWNVRGGIYKVDLSLPSFSDAVSSAISFPSTTIPVIGYPSLSLGLPRPVMPQLSRGPTAPLCW